MRPGGRPVLRSRPFVASRGPRVRFNVPVLGQVPDPSLSVPKDQAIHPEGTKEAPPPPVAVSTSRGRPSPSSAHQGVIVSDGARDGPGLVSTSPSRVKSPSHEASRLIGMADAKRSHRCSVFLEVPQSPHPLPAGDGGSGPGSQGVVRIVLFSVMSGY